MRYQPGAIAACVLVGLAMTPCRCSDKSDYTAPYLIEEDGMAGYVNKKGYVVVEAMYSNGRPFREGLASVELAGGWGFIDRDGDIVIGLGYESARDFHDGRARVEKEGEFGYVDGKGNLAVELQFDDASDFSDGYAAVWVGNECGYIDTSGSFVVNPRYDNCGPFSEGKAPVAVKTEYGYVDAEGEMTVEPQFDMAGKFSDGRAAVQLGDRWGYIDAEGDIVINPQYERARDFEEGLAAVKVRGEWGFIDPDGKEAIEPQFDDVGWFAEGLAPVQTGRQWGYVDPSGDFEINPQFDAADLFMDGGARVVMDGDLAWIDRSGDIIWQEGQVAPSRTTGLCGLFSRESSSRTVVPEKREETPAWIQKAQETEPGPGVPLHERVDLEIHVMSRCPYGAKVQVALEPVLEKMGAYVNFTQDFIATKNPDGSFKCMHGENECRGNIAQLCAAHVEPEDYFAMVACMASDYESIPENWEPCAQQADLDVAALRGCIEGQEGEDLLAESLERAVKRQARGSPTIFIGGKPYKGGRTSTAFEAAICASLDADVRPSSCPEPAVVKMTVISDERCPDCGDKTDRMKKQMQDMFGPDLQVSEMDWSEPEARELAESVGVELLPAYIFDESVKEGLAWDQMEKYLEYRAGYHVMGTKAARATFDPEAEICDNGKDDTGDGLVDCKSPDCQEKLGCREAIEGRLDIFVMSKCPYSAKVLAHIPALLKHFRKKIQVRLHFVTSVMDQEGYEVYTKKDWCTQFPDGRWVCSMHGEAETQENLRQVCAQDLYPDKHRFIDYVVCRSDDPKSDDWEACAKKVKMDADDIEACVTGEQGLDLLQADHDLGNTLNIHASPTFLWNNTVVEKASYDAEGLKTVFCKHNPQKACKKKIKSR